MDIKYIPLISRLVKTETNMKLMINMAMTYLFNMYLSRLSLISSSFVSLFFMGCAVKSNFENIDALISVVFSILTLSKDKFLKNCISHLDLARLLDI